MKITHLDFRKWAAQTLCALMLLCASLVHGATLLPSGKQQFTDGNGVPLANGTVYMYQPNTTTCKNTWQDSAQSMLNTCPIVLDAAGRAIIFGTGSYSQAVYACATPPTNCDSATGILQWNQLTTDTSASNSVFWAGQAAGTPNAITVVDAGFNATDGTVIQFIPLVTNTGATTLNPSAFGAIPVVKDTATGAVALQGGEIVANSPSNVISVVYSASQANFHLLNLVNTTAPTTPQTLCGAVGLKIVNNATPNSQMTITADQTTAISPASVTVSRTSVSYTLNITLGNVTAAVNGMDGEAPGTSAWLYVWIIDNGSGGGVLGSLSATAPTVPSGYTYKCRVGAIRVDGSGNLMRTIQLGNHVQYQVQTSGNTTSAVAIINGTGTSSNCTTASPTWESVSLAAAVPPVATEGDFILWSNYNGSGSLTATTLLAPNGNYGGTGTATTNPGFTGLQNNNVGQPLSVRMLLETAQTAFYCGGGANSSLWISGWRDKVNAQ